jgi:hypothetical protein
MPGGNVIFVIENLDTVAHTVSIPPNRFMPHKHYGDATKNPILPVKDANVRVGRGGRGTIALRLQPFKHFGFARRALWKRDQSLSMTYKYDIVTQREDGASKPITLDPDLEVDRP